MRRHMVLSASMLRGLLKLEEGIREEQRRKLDRRVKTSVMLSVAF